jgi:signal peptidase II
VSVGCGSPRVLRMTKLVRLAVLMLVVLMVVGCDQSTKVAARSCLSMAGSLDLFNGTVTLKVAENRGAFLSLGSGMPESARTLVFELAVGAGLLVGLVYLLGSTRLDRLSLIAGALIVAGGIGNLLDRLCRSGLVTDFITIRVGPLSTGVFNIADMAIITGVVSIVVFGSRTLARQANG